MFRVSGKYIQVRRQQRVIFLCFEAKETIYHLKCKLVDVMATNRPPSEIRLFIDPDWKPDEPATKPLNVANLTLLADDMTVERAGLENGMNVYLTMFDTQKGQWEDVQVKEYESLDQGMDEDMPDATVDDDDPKKKEKGKGRA
ncbi:hypothetical protein BC940DRAFT_300332 [Gongronella butleri]|nr:hypothetical protein BC940DRAFT_300332 [Gongronella butleri]